MLPLKGIITDTSPVKLSSEYSLDVLNGVVYKGNIQNEEGFKEHSSYLLDNNLTPIGIKPINNGDKIFVCIGADDDKILILDKEGNFTEKLSADLGLDINHPVDIEYQYNHKMELVIAITDGLNSPKVINLNDLPVPFNLNSIEMFPVKKEPIIDTALVQGGGSLKSGVVQIFIRYIDYDGTVTDSSIISNPISIGPSDENAGEEFVGAPAGQLTDKGIKVTITNVDMNYEKVQICILDKQDGVVNPKMVVELYNKETITYIITGNETFEDLTIEEAITPSVKYKTVKHITQVDGTLYGACVSEESEPNYQKYLLNTKLSWTSELRDFSQDPQSYKVHYNIFYNRTFQHGEVYAFYIRLKLKNGGWTRAFHIPGRVSKALPGGGVETDGNRWLWDNIGIVYKQNPNLESDFKVNAQSKFFQTRDTTQVIESDALTAKGEFGYWENENDIYPNDDNFVLDSLDLRGAKVRHHRFPTTKKMEETYNDAQYNLTKKDILGVVIDFPYDDFPQDILDNIEGYELLYAERNTANTTVLGTTSALVFSEYWGGYGNNLSPNPTVLAGSIGDEFKNRLNFNGSNTWIKSRDTDINWSDEWRPLYHNYEHRMYNPDLLYSKLGSFPDYFESLFIAHKEIPTKEKPTSEGGLGGENFIAQTEIVFTEDVKDYVKGYDATLMVPSPGISKQATPNDRIKINESSFVPQGSVYKTRNNRNAEEFVDVVLESPIELYDYEETEDTIAIGEFKYYKIDIALNFATQKLVSTGRYILNGTNSVAVYGGDAFISNYTYITHSNRLVLGNYRVSEANPRPQRTRYRFLRSFLAESKLNLNFRYEIADDAGTYFYPKSKISDTSTWFLNYKDDVTYNRIAYNKDYSSVNNLNAILPYDSDIEDLFVGEDNHKIIRSNIRKPEERNPSWRRFGANDYYIIPRDKGVITNIQGFGNALFTNTENSLFISLANEQLNIEGTTALLGAGDIFGRSFKELIPDELGYSGCQHKFSCILTPLGYFFIDVEKKRVFISDGQTVKDINNGNNIFFQDNLTNEVDNPFIQQGYTVNWDDKYSRLIVSKINGWTRSYYPSLQAWFSRHSYLPTFLYNDRYDVYSLKGKVLYKHNMENYGHFYEDEASPFYIVGIFNDSYSIDKLLTNVNWQTEVYLADEYLKHKTFDSIAVWNQYQSTDVIDIVPFDYNQTLQDNQYVANIRRKQSLWSMNRFRDLVVNSRLPFINNFTPIPSNLNTDKEFQLKRKLIDTYFIYKLLFTNEKISKLNGSEESPKIEVVDINHSYNLVKR